MKTNTEVSDRAIDWAYARLVALARNADRHAVRQLAQSFKPELWDSFIGMACCSIDRATERRRPVFPYRMVRDICLKLQKTNYTSRLHTDTPSRVSE